MEISTRPGSLKKFLDPWWSNLIQGLVFILLSFIVLSNPIAFLKTIALWLGILVFLSGLFGVAFYWVTKPENRNVWSLIGGIVAGLLGLMMISRILITVKAITVVFGLLILFCGLNILVSSIYMRASFRYWWISSLVGILAIITGIQSVLRMQEGAEAISFLMGVSLLLAGAGQLILALVKKRTPDTSGKARFESR